MEEKRSDLTPHTLTPEPVVPLYRTYPLTQYHRHSKKSGELLPVTAAENAVQMRDFSIEHKM